MLKSVENEIPLTKARNGLLNLEKLLKEHGNTITVQRGY